MELIAFCSYTHIIYVQYVYTQCRRHTYVFYKTTNTMAYYDDDGMRNLNKYKTVSKMVIHDAAAAIQILL